MTISAHNSGDSTIAKLLIQHDANVNEVNKGETMLMLAAKFGNFQFESKSI